jgi:ankyrin repeat protein
MRPVLNQILNTRFPEDAFSLEQLGGYLYDPNKRPGTDDRLVQALLPLEFLQELPQERKNDLLGQMLQDDETPTPHAIRLLREHGADVNARDAQGVPLVARALMDGMPVSALNRLKAGADVNSRGPKGATLLHLALHVDWEVNENAMEAWYEEEDVGLGPCASYLRQLLKLGADPSAANSEGVTPLQEAEKLGDEDAAEVLRKALGHGNPGN